MRFIKAHIYGFGKWTDETFIFNEHGITCIIGENESGKSTFQAFIAFILFGLRPKEREFYRPKTSGTIGGQIVVVDESGDSFTIRRVDGQQNGVAICLFPNGEIRDEKWLTSRLKGMTASLFASTFLLSTKDIATFEQIEADQIGKVLLHTSMSGAPHLYQLEKQFERTIDSLFKPRGERPKINTQLQVVESMQKQLLKHAHMAQRYEQLTEQIERAKQQMQDMQSQVEQVKKKIIIWKQLEAALPMIQQYEQVEKTYTFEDTIYFPENGMKRMEELQHVKKQYNSNIAMMQQTIDRYMTEMEQISLLATPEEQEARAILQAKEEWTYMLRTVNEWKKENEVLRSEITTRLEPFLHSIPMTVVDNIRLQPFMEKKWSDLAKQADAFDQLRIQRERTLEEEQMKRSSIHEQMLGLKEDLLTDEQLDEAKRQLEQAEEWRTHQSVRESIQKQADRSRKQAEYSYQKATRMLIGAHVITAIFILFAQVLSFPFLYNGAIISSGFSWIQWIVARKESRKQIIYAQKSPGDSTIQITEADRLIIEEKLRVHQLASESNALLFQQRDEVDRTILNQQKQLDDILHDEQLLNEQIEESIQMYPFLDTIELSYWGEVGYVLRDVHTLKHKIAQLEEQIENKQAKIDKFEQRVFQWSKQYGRVRPVDTVNVLTMEIEQLIRHHEQQKQQLQMASNEKQEALRKKDELEGKRARVNENIAALLNEASVETEEVFVAQYEKKIDQLEMKRQLEEAKQQLIHLFSPSTWQSYVGKGMDVQTIHYERLKSEAELEELETSIEKERAILATSIAEINQMERTDSVSYSERIHQFEVEKGALRALANEWATFEIARSTLEQAKQTYMETHVAEAVKRTAAHFSFLTGNRYQMIHIDPSTEALTVEDRDHIQYSVGELSKGTRDQLYISLRLAMSEQIQEKTPYPFLFDDSFVHFDQNRTERMIQLIGHLANEEQVFVFTCKEEIAELIEKNTTSERLSLIRIH